MSSNKCYVEKGILTFKIIEWDFAPLKISLFG